MLVDTMLRPSRIQYPGAIFHVMSRSTGCMGMGSAATFHT